MAYISSAMSYGRCLISNFDSVPLTLWLVRCTHETEVCRAGDRGQRSCQRPGGISCLPEEHFDQYP